MRLANRSALQITSVCGLLVGGLCGAGRARAQCSDPQWLPGQPIPGVGPGAVAASRAGPAPDGTVVAAGSFPDPRRRCHRQRGRQIGMEPRGRRPSGVAWNRHPLDPTSIRWHSHPTATSSWSAISSAVLAVVRALGAAQWDGPAWSGVGSGTDGLIASVAILPNGDIYAGGLFLTTDHSMENIARLDPRERWTGYPSATGDPTGRWSSRLSRTEACSRSGSLAPSRVGTVLNGPRLSSALGHHGAPRARERRRTCGR